MTDQPDGNGEEATREGVAALALQQPAHHVPELITPFEEVQPDKSRKEASEYLWRRWRLSYAPGSLARLGTAGRGPAYHMRGRFAYYAQPDLDAWAQTKITAPRRKTRGQTEVDAA